MPLKRELFDSFLTLLCRTSGRLAPAIGKVGSTRARYATLQHQLQPFIEPRLGERIQDQERPG